MDEFLKKSLDYHSSSPEGKISVIPSKPCSTAEDLSLAYTPGVANAVVAIDENSENAYKYTAKGNLVGVISNGSAILGLGNRGALASKPVMEGKGVLFKRFADIDVFDIEINESDPDKFIEIVKSLEPTFGGVNLEDIKAPECFHIEQTLIKESSIPIFHDDQHGTAIIASAGLVNALEIISLDIDKARVVFSGAGAAGVSCAKMFLKMGVKKENLIMCDINGVLTTDRLESIHDEAKMFATDQNLKTLADALKGANVLVGLSAAGIVSADMISSMADNPIVFAMANPTPEISYELATSTRSDIIMATGRSDYPNQINNVLGFPFIFRGALDTRARYISENMKMAASIALSKLAKEPITDEVRNAYGRDFVFGREYIVPKIFDPRLIEYVSTAVARAACEEGIAQNPIANFDDYQASLRKRMQVLLAKLKC